MFSTTLEKGGCYCVRVSAQTQNHRIPRMPHALFMCYEKHDWKEGEKQLCSTFTVSHHVKCEEEEEEDESQTQGGRHIPSRLVTGEKVLPTNQPTSPPPQLSPVTAPLSLLMTGGVCEVSPERHRLKDCIYKIHTKPAFNCL